jgi:hypothetical protein
MDPILPLNSVDLLKDLIDNHLLVPRGFGSSYKVLDSYNWGLAKLLDENAGPKYDYVFLDGAHSWAVDALAAFLSDRMPKVGGYLDFDDYDWTFSRSPSVNPRVFPLTRKFYTAEQIESKQVKMIVDLVIRRDPRGHYENRPALMQPRHF